MRKYGEYNSKRRNAVGEVQSGKTNKAGLITTFEDREFVRKIINEALEAFKQEPVDSDEELKQRLSEYFETISRTGQTPTMEELILCTGHSNSWWNNIKSGVSLGYSPETKEILEKATMLLKTIDAKLVVSGKMNFLAYCFRAKNYYGMTDKVEHVLTPNYKEAIDFNTDDIARKYGIEGYTAPALPAGDTEEPATMPSDFEPVVEPEVPKAPMYFDL